MAGVGENGAGDFGGQAVLVGDGFGGQRTKNKAVAHQKARPMPAKIEERRGWIEFSKKGTKNPKRYAYRRRWLRKDGEWVKSKPVRIKHWPPMTEDDYVKYKQQQEQAKRADRRNRRRAD